MFERRWHLPLFLAVVAADMDANAKVLARLDDDWSMAAGGRDADRVASCYAEDASAYPPNEPVAKGRAAARKVWAAYVVDQTYTISSKATHDMRKYDSRQGRHFLAIRQQRELGFSP